MHFWHFSGIGYGLHAMDRPVIGISILKQFSSSYIHGRLGYNTIKSFSSSEENLSLPCGICASCRIIDCFKLFSSGWELDLCGMPRCSAGLFVVFEFYVLFHKLLLTCISSISIGCNVPIMAVLGMWAVSYAVVIMGILSNIWHL